MNDNFKDIPETPDKPANSLPPIDNAAALLADQEIQIPEQIIEGVLHKGLKAVLGSNSKARKTWILLDLALSVATGTVWWKWPTRKGKVLFINFEIPRPFIVSRIRALCEKKEITEPGNLDVWTLRGNAAALNKLLPEIISRIKSENYSLVIIDPIYKGLGGRDENSAGDIGELCNELERIAVQTGAAVFYTAHFSKGNQANKEAIDRISGSGVWARDADTIITLTKHKEEQDHAFSVDLILRNLAEQDPFVVAWNFPLMTERKDLDPNDLKKPRGRTSTYDPADLLEFLNGERLTSTEWEKRAAAEGIKESTFFRLLKALKKSGRIAKDENGRWESLPNVISFAVPGGEVRKKQGFPS